MNLLDLPPIAVALSAGAAALQWLTDALAPVAGDSAAALAIVLATLVLRASLIPVGIAQARADQSRARLAPRIQDLRRRYGRSRDRLQRELAALYAAEGVSPVAGCLPLLAQAPVVSLVYALFVTPVIGGAPNALLAHSLFGAPLGSALAGGLVAGSLVLPTLAVAVGIAAVLVAVAESSRRLLRPIPTHAGAPAQARALALVPLLGAVVALLAPIAAGLYLAVSSAWTLGQRLLLRRRYPLEG